MGRIKSLDGLRGVAVGAVLASHALWWMHGGFLGVDVFFVLSGYLITSLLIAERRRTGRIDFPSFYRRRVARLAPAYLLMIALATPILVGPMRYRVLIPVWEAIAFTAVYCANWVGMVNIDTLGPIQHTWSLSIEEQFYLFWPITFVLLHRYKRSLTRWLIGAFVFVVVARAVGWLIHPGTWPYVATFTHSDGLLAGCLIAVLMSRPGATVTSERIRRLSRTVAWVGVAVTTALFIPLTVDSGATYLGGLVVAVVATAGVVWHLLVDRNGLLDRMMSWKPLVGIGRISYGLYLYHLPIFQFVQLYRLGFFPTLSLEVGGTFAVAVSSWYGLEKPIQHWVARRWPRKDLKPESAEAALGTGAEPAAPAAPAPAPAGRPSIAFGSRPATSTLGFDAPDGSGPRT